jgi:hypothetical protein
LTRGRRWPFKGGAAVLHGEGTEGQGVLSGGVHVLAAGGGLAQPMGGAGQPRPGSGGHGRAAAAAGGTGTIWTGEEVVDVWTWEPLCGGGGIRFDLKLNFKRIQILSNFDRSKKDFSDLNFFK